ncbi:hypothetical protein QJS04_geneDACA010577 [Acorus gramineus]|uniref:Uncharacterized protein n=1 Tax=Acorus gramineus TaxID=55184 RepID=A0AAV9AL68_ACOGR|nr:hypothetical protein QJS04_geneDACA010577 [Acorus gramineus]
MEQGHRQDAITTWKSVTAFFAAYDALCEEGTATPVCRALDEVADISVPDGDEESRGGDEEEGWGLRDGGFDKNSVCIM